MEVTISGILNQDCPDCVSMNGTHQIPTLAGGDNCVGCGGQLVFDIGCDPIVPAGIVWNIACGPTDAFIRVTVTIGTEVFEGTLLTTDCCSTIPVPFSSGAGGTACDTSNVTITAKAYGGGC